MFLDDFHHFSVEIAVRGCVEVEEIAGLVLERIAELGSDAVARGFGGYDLSDWEDDVACSGGQLLEVEFREKRDRGGLIANWWHDVW